MKIKVVEKDKNDRSNTVSLIAAIYKNDYTFIEHDINVIYPTIEKQSAMVRFEFTKSSLYISIRKNKSRIHYIVRIHLKCEMLDFSETITCSLNWTDWVNIGKLPPDSSSAADGKVHVLKMYVNFCELRDKTFINLVDDNDFFDVILISDECNPGNVGMHKPVLSAHSSRFKSMMLGQFKDAVQVKIKVEDADLQTLLDLRQYLYMGLLPNRNVLPLMLLAKNYCFDNVMKDCIFEIVNMVDSDNLLKFRNFALENELTELLEALQQITTDEIQRATYRLQRLKLSQVNARTALRKKDSHTSTPSRTRTSSQSTRK